MNSVSSSESEFITKLTQIVEANLTNPQFGVSMLARELGMSRSNLHRKVNEITKITVSQFINQVRLHQAIEILRHSSNTVSEVAHQTGFSNTSYFIRKFHEYYGYTPGEVGNRENDENYLVSLQSNKKKLRAILLSIASVIALVALLFFIFKPFSFQQKELEKTIAILPPYFEIRDSSSATIINGTIQNVIDNLNLIKDIKKVTPWLSVLKYRNSTKSAPEIAKEQNVNYLVQPSILSYDHKIQLKMTLIEGKRNIQIGSDLYDIDINDVTALNQKISKEIARRINARITPEERKRIEKKITSNGKALNYYNEGVEFINIWRLRNELTYLANLDSALNSFEKALNYDSKCASAYAQIARIYYIKDWHWDAIYLNMEPEKLYGEQIRKYAEMAYFYDSDLDLSLLAKALYNQSIRDYDLAKLYFEKALDYNPNSIILVYYLSYLYQETDETEKFLEYAVKAVNSGFIPEDNSGELRIENIYLNIGISYRHLGFFDKALEYLDMAIKTKPDFLNAIYEKSQVIQDLNRDYRQSIQLLLELAQKDSSNQSTFKFLGLAYYILRDYPNAATYYKKMIALRDKWGMRGRRDAGRLSMVFLETGETEKVQPYINEYYEYAMTLKSDLRSYNLIGYYSLTGDTEKAIEQMRIFSTCNNLDYFQIRVLKDEPAYDNIRELPEFQELLSKMETGFNERRDSIRVLLEEKGLL
jgi:AraC-like DNA-binding protein/TolB-like protein/Tfp pilus assembly protein PilF